MKEDEYNKYDASALASFIRGGEVNALEGIELAIGQIDKHNPELNAVIATDFHQAKKSLSNADQYSPLYGVPYLVKDLNTWMAGLPATNGSRAFANFIPPGDGELVRRLRKAGLVILGKTNTPEFGLNMCTEPTLFGATRNPFDNDYSAGGSSGGSACAVAAGILPVAHATDSGGSIRIPASNCGLFGLKPTRARVPLGNNQAEGLAGFSTAHAVTHSVRDSALLLDLTAGPTAGDVYSAPPSTGSFSAALSKPLPQLKIGLCTTGFANEVVHSNCKTAAQEAAILCTSIGCEVEEVSPAIDGEALREAFDILFTANISNLVSSIKQTHPTDAIETLVEPVTLACSITADRFSASDYARAILITQSAAKTLGDFFSTYDILLTPTLANPPLKIGAITMANNNWGNYLNQLLDEIPFTPLFNATGAPAASIPLGKSDRGLPVGVQIGAALGNEALLLQLAHALEKASPWHHRI